MSFIQTSKELTLAGICILLGLEHENISNFCALPASLDGFTFLMLSVEGTESPLATSNLLQRANTAIAATARFLVTIIFSFQTLVAMKLYVINEGLHFLCMIGFRVHDELVLLVRLVDWCWW